MCESVWEKSDKRAQYKSKQTATGRKTNMKRKQNSKSWIEKRSAKQKSVQNYTNQHAAKIIAKKKPMIQKHPEKDNNKPQQKKNTIKNQTD